MKGQSFAKRGAFFFWSVDRICSWQSSEFVSWNARLPPRRKADKEKIFTKVVKPLKESTIRSYDELPLMLNAKMLAKVLGISEASCYELMHEKGFPTLHVGSRIVVPKSEFIRWIEEHTER